MPSTAPQLLIMVSMGSAVCLTRVYKTAKLKFNSVLQVCRWSFSQLKYSIFIPLSYKDAALI